MKNKRDKDNTRNDENTAPNQVIVDKHYQNVVDKKNVQNKTWNILKDSNWFDFEEGDSYQMPYDLVKPIQKLSAANQLDAKISENYSISKGFVPPKIADTIRGSNEHANEQSSEKVGFKFIPIDKLLTKENEKSANYWNITFRDYSVKNQSFKKPDKSNTRSSIKEVTLTKSKSNKLFMNKEEFKNQEIEDWSSGFKWDA